MIEQISSYMNIFFDDSSIKKIKLKLFLNNHIVFEIMTDSLNLLMTVNH